MTEKSVSKFMSYVTVICMVMVATGLILAVISLAAGIFTLNGGLILASLMELIEGGIAAIAVYAMHRWWAEEAEMKPIYVVPELTLKQVLLAGSNTMFALAFIWLFDGGISLLSVLIAGVVGYCGYDLRREANKIEEEN